MSANLAPPEPQIPSPEPPAAPEPRTLNPEHSPVSRKLPPTERDFEIYEAVHIAGCSTWSQAEKHEISQTRVRQVILRVVEWLGQVLPPQAKIAREQEIHLARQIAADRFQYQLEQATELWNETKETKYASLRIRLTMAQARLGAVSGKLGGLAADAIEGLPVPAWEAPAEPNPSPTETNPQSPIQNPQSSSGRKPRRTPADQYPPELYSPICFDDISPELVALAAAHGISLPPDLIEFAKQHSPLWPRDHAESSPTASEPADPISSFILHPSEFSSPPNEDFSPQHEEAAAGPSPPTAPAAETTSTPATYGDDPAPLLTAQATEHAPAQPLLTLRNPLPVTEVQLTPDEPGATVTQSASSSADCGNHRVAPPPVTP